MTDRTDEVHPLSNVRLDSWRVTDDVGTWIVDGPVGLPPAAHEAWALGAYDASVAALGDVLRPWVLHVRTTDGEVDAEVPTAAAARAVLARSGVPLSELEAELDVSAWYASLDDARPRRGWLRVPGELVVTRTPTTGSSQLYLRLHHTLFCKEDVATAEANDALHAVNAPLLEQALRAWEAAVGPIVEVEGRGIGLHRYGFR